MKKANLSLILIVAVLGLSGCASTRKQPTVSQFRFDYEGESYRIRSIYSENKNEIRNEVIGGRFMAVDYDKDQIIDSIVLGDAELIEAQHVYDFGLDKLNKDNKLSQQVIKNGRFVFGHNELYVEIKTFQIDDREIFNQFKVYEKRKLNPAVYVFMDVNADGQLDRSLKGGCDINEYQGIYSDAINAGLKQKQLIKKDDMILVKSH